MFAKEATCSKLETTVDNSRKLIGIQRKICFKNLTNRKLLHLDNFMFQVNLPKFLRFFHVSLFDRMCSQKRDEIFDI